MKVAGSFRSSDGGSNFSLIDTVKTSGGNAFKALLQLFSNSFSLVSLGWNLLGRPELRSSLINLGLWREHR